MSQRPFYVYYTACGRNVKGRDRVFFARCKGQLQGREMLSHEHLPSLTIPPSGREGFRISLSALSFKRPRGESADSPSLDPPHGGNLRGFPKGASQGPLLVALRWVQGRKSKSFPAARGKRPDRGTPPLSVPLSGSSFAQRKNKNRRPAGDGFLKNTFRGCFIKFRAVL